jgi:cation diffusion facilitator CzcD-associated flavoprotein CzcO
MGLSFVIVERAQEVGGTWRDNTYPGGGNSGSVKRVRSYAAILDRPDRN